jgi:methionyl-tRNA synthetase
MHIAGTPIARNWVIFNCAEAVRIASILLQPIIPSKATRLLDEIKVLPERRTLEWAKYGADTDYGLTREDRAALPKRVHPWEAIFPPVAAAELTDEQLKEEFGDVFANRKIGGHQPTRVAHYIEVQERMGADAVRELVEERKRKESQVSRVLRPGGDEEGRR